MEQNKMLPQRWLALVGMVTVLFILQFSILITAGAAVTVMTEYGFTPAQFGILCNMPFLAGVLFGILTGNLGDRYGIKKMMTIGLVVFVAGAFLRAFAVSFLPLCVASLIMGYGMAVLNANSTKAIRLWFPGESMGPAMGVYVCGASIGAGIALKIGATFATSHGAFMLCGWLSIVALVVWTVLFPSHPNENAGKNVVGKGQFMMVMKDKNVWIISVLVFFIFACSTTEQTYVNAALSELGGGDMATASSIALVSTIAVAIGSITMPLVFARFKKFRPVMAAVCVLNGLVIVLIYVLPFGAATFGLFILQGAFLGAMLSMSKTAPALMPGIDPANLGAVGGVQSTLQNIGCWVVAGYMIAPICQAFFPSTVYRAIYVGAAICSVLAAVTVMFLPELPTSVAAKIKQEMESGK